MINRYNEIASLDLDDYFSNLFRSIIFIGNYTGRLFVSHLDQELDEIILSESETELREKLFTLRMEVHEDYFDEIKTSNILLKEDSSTIYSNLPPDCPVGVHWFKIRRVKVDDNWNIIFKLEVFRSFDIKAGMELRGPQGDIIDEARPSSEAQSNFPHKTNVKLGRGPSGLGPTARGPSQIDMDNDMHNVQGLQGQHETLGDNMEPCNILLVIVVTIIKGTFVAIKFTANFLLALVRELSFFVESMTPFLLETLNVIYKILGGVFSLIVMVALSAMRRREIAQDAGYLNLTDYRPRQVRILAISYYGSKKSVTLKDCSSCRQLSKRRRL